MKMLKNLLMVSGTYSFETPKESKSAAALFDALKPMFQDALHITDGTPNRLTYALGQLKATFFDVVVWIPHVPDNAYPKRRNIKEISPKSILVTSKRNDDTKYSLQEMIAHALDLKSNLFIEFSRDDQPGLHARLLDPLGNLWADTRDMTELGTAMGHRLEQLAGFTRVKSIGFGGDSLVLPRPGWDGDPFYDVVRGNAEKFHSLIHPAGTVNRFLGNASFRCADGFPSMRKDNMIYVSKRNLDKRSIGPDSFVPVVPSTGNPYEPVVYFGGAKPSVDTPIQKFLYWYYPLINFMVHSHTYIDTVSTRTLGYDWTEQPIPCGSLEEISEILKIAPHRDTVFFALNLIGHGSLVGAKSLRDLRGVTYRSRPVPEDMTGRR